MSTFHPFPRLPLELRRHIWEMSMQPREIPIHLNRQYCYSPTKTPAILHSCGESRSHLQSIYTKAFKLGSQPRYIWVNFDLDTIRVDQGWLMAIFAEWTSIRHLALGCSDLGWLQEFYMDDVRALRDIGLRTLTFIDTRGPTVNGPISRLDEVWWEPWSSIVMVELYYRCDPMPFYTRVIAPSDPKRIEINSDDYISQYRAYRKALYAADPEHWGESIAYESETESEDGRERWFGDTYPDEEDSLTLSNKPKKDGGSLLTVDKRETACFIDTFLYAGVKAGTECWCGDYVGNERAIELRPIATSGLDNP